MDHVDGPARPLRGSSLEGLPAFVLLPSKNRSLTYSRLKLLKLPRDATSRWLSSSGLDMRSDPDTL